MSESILIVLASTQITEEQKRVLRWAYRKCREIEAENERGAWSLGVEEL